MIPNKDYWDAPTIEEARRKIYSEYDGKTWDGQTEAVMPLILTDAVRRNLLYPPLSQSWALEIGCGIGRLLKPMSGIFSTVIGVDFSETMVSFSGKYLGDLENVAVLKNDGETLFPVVDSTVSFVYSVITFQHLQSRENVQSYIREAFRVLRPGGVARIQTYCGAPHVIDAVSGYYYPTIEDFAREFSDAGFIVHEAEKGIWHKDHLWVTAIKSLDEGT